MRGALITADLVTLHFKRRYAADSQASTTTQQLINQQPAGLSSSLLYKDLVKIQGFNLLHFIEDMVLSEVFFVSEA